MRKRNRTKHCENIISIFVFRGLGFHADISVLILKDVLELLITHFPADIETVPFFFCLFVCFDLFCFVLFFVLFLFFFEKFATLCRGYMLL